MKLDNLDLVLGVIAPIFIMAIGVVSNAYVFNTKEVVLAHESRSSRHEKVYLPAELSAIAEARDAALKVIKMQEEDRKPASQKKAEAEQENKRYKSLYAEASHRLSVACDERESIANKLNKASELEERLPTILFCLKEAKVELATYTSPQVRAKITERINGYEEEFFAGKEYLEGFNRPKLLVEFERASVNCSAAIANWKCVQARTCDF